MVPWSRRRASVLLAVASYLACFRPRTFLKLRPSEPAAPPGGKIRHRFVPCRRHSRSWAQLPRVDVETGDAPDPIGLAAAGRPGDQADDRSAAPDGVGVRQVRIGPLAEVKGHAATLADVGI